MASKFHHEAIYRGADSLAKLAGLQVTLCGAGALGSQLADNLARQGVQHLRVIDRDRVEEHNVSTQLYGESDVGAWKVEVLRQRLFRATGWTGSRHVRQFRFAPPGSGLMSSVAATLPPCRSPRGLR